MLSILFRRSTSGFRNVKVVGKALWRSKGVLELRTAYDMTNSSLLDVNCNLSYRGSTKVDATRLDDYTSESGIWEIGFLKVDAEGAEPEVIEGAEGILDKIKAIAVDCGPECYGRTTSGKVKDILESGNFQICMRDNIIHAFKDETRP